MTAYRPPSLLGLLLGLAIAGFLASPRAFAQPSKEQCIDAHGRGQDAKEQGKLSLARKLFLTCAQPSCPALVQGDCARFADDLIRQQSSLTFLARDAQGNDLPDTAVYVDDVLLLTRLDDGKPHEVDPGRHTVRFSSGGKDQVITLVVGTGEQGRAVVGTFPMINPRVVAAPSDLASRDLEIRSTHPTGSKVLMLGGAIATGVGVGFYIWGRLSLPKACSTGPNQCLAAPGDPVFADAESAMQRANIGIITGSIGAAALAGGVLWYYMQAEDERTTRVGAILTPSQTGIAVSGHF